jgi:hypothetical protein
VAYDMFLVGHDYPVFAFFIPIIATRNVKAIRPMRISEGRIGLSRRLYKETDPNIRREK